jgi:hypothetical protein
MQERKRYIHISFDKAIADWIQPLVDSKATGFESLTEFIVHAARDKLDYYLEIGVHPWSAARRSVTKPSKDAANGIHAGLAVVLLAALGALGFSSMVPGMTGFVAGNLPPALNFIAFYHEHWLFIDFIIYTFIFVSTAYATLGRMFEHRGIAIGVGALLALAMVGLEAAFGFGIADFGTFAAAILIMILAATLYHTFRRLHFDFFGATSVTLLLIYMGIIVLIPPVSLWLHRKIPILGYLVTIVFILGLYHLATRTFRRRPSIGLELAPGAPPEVQALYPELKEEEEILTKYLAGITKRARKDAKTIATELTYVYHVLSKFGDTPESRKLIADRLKTIIPKEHDVEVSLAQLQDLLKRIAATDEKVLRALQSGFKKLGQQDKRKLQKNIQSALQRIDAEEKLKELHNQAKSAREALLTQVNAAVQALNQSKLGEAKQALVEAVREANRAGELLDQARSLQEVIEEVVKRELEEFKPRR